MDPFILYRETDWMGKKTQQMISTTIENATKKERKKKEER